MATYTPNYNLEKPEATDPFENFRQSYNGNMDIIDQNMGGGGGGGGHTIVDENGSDMPQESKLQFTGNVNVSDDAVNGQTVVDVVQEVVEVTEAEYETIPVAERESNGVAYFIKDLNNSSVQGYPPLIYSDEEREIGVWRNGKPLYQKSIDLGSDKSISHTSWYNAIVSITDIENITLCFGLYSGGTYYPLMAYHTGDDVNVLACRANSGATVRYLTLMYTKSSDTAGSGIWNGQGGIAHHYSTSETIIGTWIDGKPLYEKSFNLPSTITINNSSWTSTGVSIPNIKNVVDGELNRNGEQKFACSFRATSSVIEIQTYFNGAQCNTDSVVTVQYTKTTD